MIILIATLLGVTHGAPSKATPIESLDLIGTDIHLVLTTDWERRYRIEVSRDLTTWRTATISPSAEGISLAVRLPRSGSESQFFRASLFEWEEVHAEWLEARQRWRSQGVSTYRFECRWNCNCPFWGWAQVQVRDGIVVEVVAVDTGLPLPREQWSLYLSIDGLFDWIESRRRLHPVELRAAFDPALGHPVSGFADLSRFIADEELGFEVRAVSF
ncbi:MAG: DUF6174 domain-containing protein [Verrucomicrobiota bacterium]